jgi:hypothetical protein
MVRFIHIHIYTTILNKKKHIYNYTAFFYQKIKIIMLVSTNLQINTLKTTMLISCPLISENMLFWTELLDSVTQYHDD